MASNYPTSLDNFTNPTSNDSLNSPSHSLQHANINDAVEAIEAKLGIGASPAGSATSGYVLTAGTGGTTTWSAPSIAALTQIVPTSIVKGASGSASVSTDGAVTFSGTESIALNGCFSATYDNYLLVMNYLTSNTNTQVRGRYRTGGTDNSTSNYNMQNIIASNTTLFTERYTAQSSAFLTNSAGEELGMTTQIFSPFLSKATFSTANSSHGVSATKIENFVFNNAFNGTTSFDGINIYPLAGTISGTIRVYGYKNG